MNDMPPEQVIEIDEDGVVHYPPDERAALQAEVERLKAALEGSYSAADAAGKAWRERAEAIEAERDTLRAVLRDVAQQMRHFMNNSASGDWRDYYPERRVEQWADTLAAALRPTGAGEESKA